MTILGKILVIVNFLFSLVTGALIIMVFVTRTNWKTSYDNMKKQYDIAQASAAAAHEQIVQATKDRDAQVTAKEQALKAAETVRVDLQKKLDIKSADRDAIEQRAAAAEANLNKATEELKRRELEVASLKDVTVAKDKKLMSLEDSNKTMRDKMVTSDIAYRGEHDRNMALLEQLDKMAKDYDRLLATKGGAPAGANGSALAMKPPPQDVRGKIEDADSKTGLVTISIGSDSGLSVGNTLQVYRLDPKPDYVGTIRIVNVDFKQAVARAIMPLRAGPLKAGDLVASRILPPR